MWTHVVVAVGRGDEYYADHRHKIIGKKCYFNPNPRRDDFVHMGFGWWQADLTIKGFEGKIFHRIKLRKLEKRGGEKC